MESWIHILKYRMEHKVTNKLALSIRVFLNTYETDINFFIFMSLDNEVSHLPFLVRIRILYCSDNCYTTYIVFRVLFPA